MRLCQREQSLHTAKVAEEVALGMAGNGMAPSCCSDSGLKPCIFFDLHVLFVSFCVYIYTENMYIKFVFLYLVFI